MKQKAFLIHLYALLAMLFWGMSYIWTKSVFEYVDPATTVLYRLVISASLLLGLMYINGKLKSVSAAEFKLLLLSSLFNPFLYFLAESYGLLLVTPTISAVIIATIPVFMPIVAWFALRERLSVLNIIGLLISFIGILVMIVDSSYSLVASGKGILLLFGAVAAALVYGVLLRKLTFKLNPLTIIAYQNSIGIVYFLPIVLWLNGADTLIPPLHTDFIINILLLGVLASSVAYVLYTQTVRVLGISKANIYTNLIPVFTAFFSFVIFGEAITVKNISGILLVISGVAIAQIKSKNHNI